jgi:hypothetical protein
MRDLERVTGRIVVCFPTTLPARSVDEAQGTCAICAQPVRFRPSTPATRTLVCLQCFLLKAEPGERCELLGQDEWIVMGGPTC